MARFRVGEQDESRATPGRPFDITEYTAAAAEFTRTAHELTALIDTLERDGVPLAEVVTGGVEAGQGLVDYLFWRTLILGVSLIAVALLAAHSHALSIRAARLRPTTAADASRTSISPVGNRCVALRKSSRCRAPEQRRCLCSS
jgi:hypothetical protein